jgi:hypothetical protein
MHKGIQKGASSDQQVCTVGGRYEEVLTLYGLLYDKVGTRLHALVTPMTEPSRPQGDHLEIAETLLSLAGTWHQEGLLQHASEAYTRALQSLERLCESSDHPSLVAARRGVRETGTGQVPKLI